MKEPCIDCTNKQTDEYGYFCDLSCGKRTAWVNYQAGIKETVKWVNNYWTNVIPPIVTQVSLNKFYKEWQSQMEDWGIND